MIDHCQQLGTLEIIKICGAVCKYGVIKSEACFNLIHLYFINAHIPSRTKKKTSISQCQIVLRNETQKETSNFQISGFPLGTFAQPSA